MFNAPPRESELGSWLYAGLWTLVIWSTIPFARAITKFFATHWGRDQFITITALAAILGAGTAILFVIRQPRAGRWQRALVLAVIGGVFVGVARLKALAPEEALHYLEYGILGVLLYRALTHRIRDPLIYLAALVAGALIGTGDEIIQWLTPRRIFEYRDIRMNVLGVALALTAIAAGIRPLLIRRPIRPSSVVITCRQTLALLALLFLCALNTPARANRIAMRIPGLGGFYNRESVMTEFGHRHVDPEIGVFYSRFTLEQLRAMDTARAADAAPIIAAYRSHARYPDFLRDYPSARDPFVHELRVHLFRREHYGSFVRQSLTNPAVLRDNGTVAFRENQILEKYFSNTLAQAGCRIRPAEADFIRRHADTNALYTSPVSAHLITRINAFELHGSLALLFLAVLLVERRATRHARVCHLLPDG